MPDSKVNAKKISAAQRRIQALKLRLAGHTYREIGEIMGISNARANQLCEDQFTVLKQEQKELIQEYQKLSLDRLEALLKAHWLKATEGDTEAAGLVLRLMDRQSKLLGLDAPARSITASLQAADLSEEELKEEARRLGVPIPGEPTADQIPTMSA